MNRLNRTFLAILAVGGLLAAPSAGQSGADNDPGKLAQALDRPIQLQATNARIGDLFRTLGEKSHVKFVLDQDAVDFLPYGLDTRLDVTIKNVTLRQALSPILSRQGLKWEIDGREIRIRPTDALARMCRRATFKELTILGTLYSVRLKAPAQAGPAMRQLRQVEGLGELRLLPHVPVDPKVDYARADAALPGTGAAWLDMLCYGKDWTWYVWGDRIMILDKVTQVARQLEKRVTLSYENTPLMMILLDLARQARVGLTLRPGVMNFLPPATRDRFNIKMGAASISQALQVISGATGLEFIHTGDGLVVQASETLKSQALARPAGRRPRFLVRLTLPGPGGTNMDVFLRPAELPDDVVRMIDKAKEDYIARLRGQETDQSPGQATDQLP